MSAPVQLKLLKMLNQKKLEKDQSQLKPNTKTHRQTHTQTPGNPQNMKSVSDSESKDRDASAPESPKAEV